ncbi:MAG: hypothetical protein JWM16_3588 [Verrucomicrobiales bacterium]|nr:hypothetical protein [Verrucomicrobiales bacterium]
MEEFSWLGRSTIVAMIAATLSLEAVIAEMEG